MATNMEDEQAIRECQDYVEHYNIQQLLKECIVQLCVNRPPNPISFLREHFQKLERVSDVFLRHSIALLINYLCSWAFVSNATLHSVVSASGLCFDKQM